IKQDEKGHLLSLTSDSLGKMIEKKYRGSLDLYDDLWQVGAEAAGEVFGIEPEYLYSEDEFLTKLIGIIKEYRLKVKVYDNFGFSPGQSLKKKLKFADAPGRCLAMYKYIKETHSSNKSIIGDATVLMFPLEFLGAIFLYLADIKI
ncbi:MAG: hypothetical protein Q4C00_04265, partial [Bacillota bacterium]|nr:hypothetical protein [Bacillota bacterium]